MGDTDGDGDYDQLYSIGGRSFSIWNTVFVYDVTNPVRPVYLQHLLTGDAPEGIHFVSAEKSPTGRSLLIVSSEEDGVVKVYSSF